MDLLSKVGVEAATVGDPALLHTLMASRCSLLQEWWDSTCVRTARPVEMTQDSMDSEMSTLALARCSSLFDI